MTKVRVARSPHNLITGLPQLFFIASLTLNLLTGCSPARWMTYSLRETVQLPTASPYGSPIEIRYRWKDTIIYVDPKDESTTYHIRQRKGTLYGELIACDSHQIYIYTIDGEWLKVSVSQIKRLRLYLYERRIPNFFSWHGSLILAPFTILHLALVAIEFPSYLGWGILTNFMDKFTRKETYHRFQRIQLTPRHRPRDRLKLTESLLPYARFPGGLPPGWKNRFRSP